MKTKETTFPKKGGGTITHPVVNRMPKGWKVIEGALTAPNGYTWINNGKSRFKKGPSGKSEYQHALIETSRLGTTAG